MAFINKTLHFSYVYMYNSNMCEGQMVLSVQELKIVCLSTAL